MPAAPEEIHDDLIFGLDVWSLWRQIFRIGLGQSFNIVFEGFQVFHLKPYMIKTRSLMLRAEVVLDLIGS